MGKWGKRYWADLGERVGTTAIYGLMTMLTADKSGIVSGSPQQWWLVVGLPTALVGLKGLAVNLMNGDGPSASLVGATSTTDASSE